MRWLAQNLAARYDLAQAFTVSTRTLLRRFAEEADQSRSNTRIPHARDVPATSSKRRAALSPESVPRSVTGIPAPSPSAPDGARGTIVRPSAVAPAENRLLQSLERHLSVSHSASRLHSPFSLRRAKRVSLHQSHAQGAGGAGDCFGRRSGWLPYVDRDRDRTEPLAGRQPDRCFGDHETVFGLP